MRICHWVTFPKDDRVSGLTRSVKEILEAELELGIDAGVCGHKNPEGGEEIRLWRRSVKSKPWSWALEADANVISATPSLEMFKKLRGTILFLHAIPFHSFLKEMTERKPSMSAIYAMLRMCDTAVCWSTFEAEYYRLLSEKPVHVVTRCIDLDHWSPGEGMKFIWHPTVVNMEVGRVMKLPFTLLFAANLAQRRIPNLKLEMFALRPDQQGMWDILVAKLNLEIIVENMVYAMWTDPREVYRGADILVSPTWWGLTSRVAVEAMACGCPTLIIEGQDDKPASAKCFDSPQSMSEAIVNLWERMKEDPEGERRRARRIAEESYDVKETAKEIVEIAKKLAS